jgi:hypothetical protein
LIARGRAIAAAISLAALPLAVRAADAPAAPVLPGGVADASGALGYLAAGDGTVTAVDLAGGQGRWSTRLGRWPLAAGPGWLAVAAPDGAQRNTLRVRFLRPADGKLLGEAPVRFPDRIVVSDQGDSIDGEVVFAGHNASLTLSSDADAGRLRISWVAQSWIPSGFRPSPVQKVSGVVLVDPARGSVEQRPGTEPPPAPSLLPTDFKPARDVLYWSWTRWSAGWSDKPRAFAIGPGVVAFFSYESRPVRRLLLNRRRNGAPLPPVEIASGGEYAPLVSADGRVLVLTSGTAERPVLTLYDLTRAGGTPPPVPARLPALGMRFRPPFSVIGARLYFVAEDDGTMTGPNYGTVFPRRLVALDTASGHVSWMHPLAARILPAPTPGAR